MSLASPRVRAVRADLLTHPAHVGGQRKPASIPAGIRIASHRRANRAAPAAASRSLLARARKICEEGAN